MNQEDLDLIKPPTVSLLRAVAQGNTELLTSAFARLRSENGPHLDSEIADLLRTWTVEALTLTWRIFKPEDAAGLHYDRPTVYRIAKILDMGARPVIAIKAALLTAIEERGNVSICA